MKDFERKLYSLQKFGVKLGLQNIEQFLELLGRPHKELKFFHIAGTNGKGSVASYIASILIEEGYKVGLYTSPHLVRFNERIKVNGEEIDDLYIEKFIDKWIDYIIENKLTFFETTTALALCYFRDKNVDFVSWETGLGGRLDATNVVDPLVSIITTISFDHMEYLGNNLISIANEKAGIIKPNKIVCVGLLPQEAYYTIEKIAKERNNLFLSVKNFLQIENENYYLNYKSFKILLKPALIGSYQKINSALATLSVLAALDVRISSIEKGLKNVIRNTKFEGRFEIVNQMPLVIFDAAHNLEGVENFTREFAKISSDKIKKILLFGVMKDKQVKNMIELVKNLFDQILFVSIPEERSLKYEDFKILAVDANVINYSYCEDPSSYIIKFINDKKNKDNVLAFCGSIYVMGHIKKKLNEL